MNRTYLTHYDIHVYGLKIFQTKISNTITLFRPTL